MRVVIDMQGAQSESRFRGIGTYTTALTKALIRNRGEHEVVLALSDLFSETVEPIRADFEDLLPQENIRVWSSPAPVRELDLSNDWRRNTAELVREAFLASLKPDFVHVSSLFEGYGNEAVTSIGRLGNDVLTSVTVYDLIPLLNPKVFFETDPRFSTNYHKKLDYLKSASLLLAISNAAREEVLGHLTLSPDSVVAIGSAADKNFRRLEISDSEAASVYRRFGITRPFLLHTGTAEIRKNLPRLIRAYAALPDRLRCSHQLVFTGKILDSQRQQLEIEAKYSGLAEDEIVFAGYASNTDLVKLYNLCKLYVIPSYHEGFGLPALEAMRCGVPVIGSNRSSLPEVIGLAEALFDPGSTQSLVSKLWAGLTDESFREKLIRHGSRQAENFSWDKSACRVLSAMEQIRAARYPKATAVTGKSHKPTMAYISPLPPEATGIAEYAAHLLPALSEYYDIELIVSQDSVDKWFLKKFSVLDVDQFREKASSYDRIVYQFGNSEYHLHMFDLLADYPGTVVLHDFFLSGALAYMEGHRIVPAGLANGLYLSHGYRALKEKLDAERGGDGQAHNDVVYRYPCNLEVVQNANNIICHSDHSRELATKWLGPEAVKKWSGVPLVRGPGKKDDKLSARHRLGLSTDNFLVCSFGIMADTKLNHKLLDAWFRSQIISSSRGRLVFVGEPDPGGYGDSIANLIEHNDRKNTVQITGWLDNATFETWLGAADVAVQLRTFSRGETSAAVLSCMQHGLATVVNAHGSLKELPRHAVWMLEHEFEQNDLIKALESLWRSESLRQELGQSAARVIQQEYNPQLCSKRYFEIIEGAYEQPRDPVGVLEKSIFSEVDPVRDDMLISLASHVAQNHPPEPRRKQLFLDISELVVMDRRTGIQRVARALMHELLLNPPPNWVVEPIFSNEESNSYHYARQFISRFLGVDARWATDEPVDCRPGDNFLSLEFDPGVLLRQYDDLKRWRRRGAKLYSLVHDLLPISRPALFPDFVNRAQGQWLDIIAEFDGAICVSRSVADQLNQWLRQSGIERTSRFSIGWIHHGADISSSAPSGGIRHHDAQAFTQLAGGTTFLMVGTVEPRKCHSQVLEAFEILWDQRADANLCIVGKAGWNVDRLTDKIRNHPESGNRLLWLEGLSDEHLKKLYEDVDCLIMASVDEGFGLPLIEAAHHALPIIARDIPVFREVAGDHAYYVRADTPGELAAQIAQWMDLYRDKRHPESVAMPRLTWAESTSKLVRILTEGDWYIPRVGDSQQPARSVRRAGSAESAGERPITARTETLKARKLQDRSYVEDICDMELNTDKGPLSGKEVLVYSPAKCGTTSLYWMVHNYLALRRHWKRPENHMLHAHGNDPLINSCALPAYIDKTELRERYVIRDLLEYKANTGGHMQIITACRDPVRRLFSYVFHYLDHRFLQMEDMDVADLSFEFCYEVFGKQLNEICRQHHTLEEIEDRFFARERFDQQRKYAYVKRSHYEILALTVEHSATWETALHEAFGYTGIKTKHINAMKDKRIVELYGEFVQAVKLPRKSIRNIYYGDHPLRKALAWFYSKEEIDGFYERALQQFAEPIRGVSVSVEKR